MKISKLFNALVLVLSVSASSAQITVQPSNNVPPTYTYSYGPTNPGPTVYIGQKASAKQKLPDMKMSNSHYHLDCFDKTPGACEKLSKALTKLK